MAQWVKGSSIVTAVAWVTAEVWVQSLAQDLPFTTGEVKIRIKKKARLLPLRIAQSTVPLKNILQKIPSPP